MTLLIFFDKGIISFEKMDDIREEIRENFFTEQGEGYSDKRRNYIGRFAV